MTDFGLAKEIDVTKSNASGSGTPGFMTPELMKDLILSPTYDIFSYGVVLFELWTTNAPFKGEDQYAIVWKVCKNNELPPIPADCPKPIADLMMQCWEVDWKSRPEIGHVLAVVSQQCTRLRQNIYLHTCEAVRGLINGNLWQTSL